MPSAPRHRVAHARRGLGLGRAAGRVVSTTASSTTTASPARRQTARGLIIDHTPGALYQVLPPKEVPTSHVIYEAPAALLSDLRRGGRRQVGVYGKVLRSRRRRVGVYCNTTVNECVDTWISNRQRTRPPPVVSDQVCYAT